MSAKTMKKKEEHRALEPTIAWDILEILRKHEDTTIVTCTRVASALVNELATKVLFQDVKKKPLSKLPLDYESNQSDYDSKWKLQPKIKLEAALTDIYKGMKVVLTNNIDTKNGFCNGMFAVVEDFDENTQCLTVNTRTGKTLGIHPVTEEVEGHSKVTYFPVRVGYACTISMVQGMTLPHVTIWFDKPVCPVAAYVAMTRVPMDDKYLVAGKLCPRIDGQDEAVKIKPGNIRPQSWKKIPYELEDRVAIVGDIVFNLEAQPGNRRFSEMLATDL